MPIAVPTVTHIAALPTRNVSTIPVDSTAAGRYQQPPAFKELLYRNELTSFIGSLMRTVRCGWLTIVRPRVIVNGQMSQGQDGIHGFWQVQLSTLSSEH